MTKYLNTFLYILLITVMITGCSGGKAVSAKSGDNKSNLTEARELEMRGKYIEAQGKKNIGNFEDAIKLLNEVLAINPKHDAALYDLALILNSTGEYDSAIASIEKATSINPDNIWYQMLSGELYAVTNQLEKAEQLYQNLVNKDKENYEFNYELATLRMQMGKYPEAIESLNQIEARTGFNEELIFQKQALYVELNDLEKAKAEVQKLIDHDPSQARYYGIMAEIYAMENNEAKTIEYYKKVEELEPNNGLVKLALYDFYNSTGDYDKSKTVIYEAFGNEEIDIDTKMDILFDYYERTDLDKSDLIDAYELIDLLIQNHPDEAKSYAIKGDFLIRDDKKEEARLAFIKASELDPSRLIIWDQVLNLDAQLNKYDDLVNHSQDALELFPTNPLFYYYNGVANNQKGQHQKAIENLSIGKEMVVNNPALESEFYISLADAYNATEDHKKSDEYFDKSLNINPNNAFVLNNYSYYLSERGENLDKAVEMSRKSNELEPNNASFQDTFAWILFKDGQYTKAKEWIQKALNNGGDSSGIINEHYGDILYELGEKTKAIELWLIAKQLGDHSDELLNKIENNN